MEISSDDGAWLRMWPVGYQPGVHPPAESDEDGWDDWLVIAVSAATADRKGWSFRSSCLTTGEAGELGEWLRRPESALRFTEPNLVFRAAHRTLVVDFSYESLPP